MAQVIALSTELGGDLRAIAIVQTVRVLLLVVGLPNGLALFGLVVPALPVPRGPAGFAVLGEMIVLVAVSTAFALAFPALALSRRTVVRRHGGLGPPARHRPRSTPRCRGGSARAP